MLISIAISLLIFFNLDLALNGLFFLPEEINSPETGIVLGAAEYEKASKLTVNQDSNFSQIIIKELEDAKTLSMARPFQLPRPDQPTLKIAKDQIKKPEIIIADYDFPAQNGVILDCDDDRLLFAKRSERSWPIASITKLFTAYTFLDYNPGWGLSYEIKLSDRREGGKIYLFTGDKVTIKDLFYFSLVGSDNTATAGLVRATGLSEAEFVEKMNAKIKELGFKNTRLVDPIGLKDGNISTAREVALFAKIALAKEEINRASLTKIYEFSTAQGRKKTIVNTNELLDSFPDEGVSLLGGKTGYVDSSGYCLVSQFKNYEGREIITVVLGADSDSGRFNLTRKLVDLYYKNKP